MSTSGLKSRSFMSCEWRPRTEIERLHDSNHVWRCTFRKGLSGETIDEIGEICGQLSMQYGGLTLSVADHLSLFRPFPERQVDGWVSISGYADRALSSRYQFQKATMRAGHHEVMGTSHGDQLKYGVTGSRHPSPNNPPSSVISTTPTGASGATSTPNRSWSSCWRSRSRPLSTRA